MKNDDDKQFERIAASMREQESRFNGQLVTGIIVAFVIQVLMFSTGIWLIFNGLFTVFGLDFAIGYWTALGVGLGYALITLVIKGFDFD